MNGEGGASRASGSTEGRIHGRMGTRPPFDSPEAVLVAVRRHLRAGTRRVAAAAVLGAFALLLLLGWGFAGTEGWAPGTATPLLLWGGILALFTTFAALLTLRLRRWTEERTLAGEVERSAGLPDGALQAQLQLGREPPSGSSPSLVRAGERSLLARLTAEPGALAGAPGQHLRKELGRALRGALLLALLALSLPVVTPERTRAAWAGLAAPMALLFPPPLPPLSVDPGDAALPRGSEPRVGIRAPGRDSVTLIRESVGEPVVRESVPLDGGMGSLTLPPLRAPIRYRIQAPDGARTPTFTLTPVDPGLVVDLQVELHFPPHTRRLPERFAGVVPPLRLPEGSTLHLSGGVAGVGSGVELRDGGDNALLTLSLEGGRFSGVWRPTRSGVARWSVVDGEEGARLPEPLEVELIPDAPPSVALPRPGGEVELPLSLRYALEVEASDDYGVAWVEIEVVPIPAGGAPEDPVVERIPTGERTEVTLAPILDVSEWGLPSGSTLRLRARAADNAPNPQVTETPTYTLHLPTTREIRDEAIRRLEEGEEAVVGMAGRAGSEAERLREMAAAMERSGARRMGEAGFQDREAATGAGDRLRELEAELSAMEAGLREAMEALAGSPEDRALLEQLQALESLLSAALSPEDRERLHTLMERLESGSRVDLPGELEELAALQERMRERLEEAVERIRRAALEAGLRGAEEAARSLAEAQDRVAEALRQGAGEEEQRAVSQEAGTLSERLEALTRSLERAGEGRAAERTERASERVEGARDEMTRAGEAAAEGATTPAGEAAEAAAAAIREAAEELEGARDEWTEAWEEEIRSTLHAGAQAALALARRQGEIRAGMAGAGALRRSTLQGEEAGVAEGIRNLATLLAPALRQAPEVGRELSLSLGVAMEAAERTIEGLGNGVARGLSPHAAAGEALEALNRVALLALLGAENPGGSGESGAGELLRQLESLASLQEGLNQETAAAGEGGGEPAPSLLEELARAQGGMAGELSRMGREPGSDQILGDLEAMAEEARRIAELLAEGRLEGETLDRQAELLERLLQAGRSLEREGDTEEREGSPAGAVERRAVLPLPEELLRTLALPLPTAEALARLTPAERRMVLDYFDRVNRRLTGGTTPEGRR